MRATRGYTLVEILIAMAIASVLLFTALVFLRMGTQHTVKVVDVADTRIEALRILDLIQWDIDRLVVGDDIDNPNASVLKPFKAVVDREFGSQFMFYAFHHLDYYKAEPGLTDKQNAQLGLPRMMMAAQMIEYHVQKSATGRGVDLMRNNQKVNRLPLYDVRLDRVAKQVAQSMGCSENHTLVVKILPMGQWDQYNANIWKYNAVERTYHLKGVESRFASLLSMKRAFGAYPVDPVQEPELFKLSQQFALLPDPDDFGTVDPSGGSVVLDWMQPQCVVKDLSKVTRSFDDSTADQMQEIYPPTAPCPLCGY